MTKDADEFSFADDNVDVFDRHERAIIRLKGFREAGQLEGDRAGRQASLLAAPVGSASRRISVRMVVGSAFRRTVVASAFRPISGVCFKSGRGRIPRLTWDVSVSTTCVRTRIASWSWASCADVRGLGIATATG